MQRLMQFMIWIVASCEDAVFSFRKPNWTVTIVPEDPPSIPFILEDVEASVVVGHVQ